MMRSINFVYIVLFVFALAFMSFCRKDKISSNPDHVDTIIVVNEVDTCSGVASLPINCYTTPFMRGYRSIVKADTLDLKPDQCIWFGNCSNKKFTSIYKVCVEGIHDYRIPDTSMCRQDSLDLCCVDFYDYYSTCNKYTPAPGDFWDDVGGPDKPVDVASVYFTGISYCYVRSGFKYESVLGGPTKYAPEPIDSPAGIDHNLCPFYHLFSTPDSVKCRQFKVGSCTINIIDVFPRPDSVQGAYYSGFGNGSPCCTGSYSSTLKDSVQRVRVEISCN
ncbi:MAG: hypothetical protein GXO48_03980 [Chlorobi bacterium]|nr:hypothetical protein [Chlorobiota bacterium]